MLQSPVLQEGRKEMIPVLGIYHVGLGPSSRVIVLMHLCLFRRCPSALEFRQDCCPQIQRKDLYLKRGRKVKGVGQKKGPCVADCSIGKKTRLYHGETGQVAIP